MGGTLWMRIVCIAGLFEFFQFDGGAAVLGAAFLGTVVGNGLVGSLAHAFDALGRGTQFDPDVVDAFLKIADSLPDIYEQFKDTGT